MGAGSYRNTLPIDDGRDVMGMRALYLERDHRSFAARGADQAQRIDFAQALLGVGQKAMLVRGNAFLADRIDVIDRSTETYRLDDRRRSRLEFVRRIAIGDPVFRDLADHLAAAIVGPHRREMRVLSIEHADAGRTVELVAGEDVEVAVDIPDIDGQMNAGLAAVDQDRDTAGMGDPDHVLD